MKKILVIALCVMSASAVMAQAKRNARGARPVAQTEGPTTGKAAKILIDQFPKLGRASTLAAPNIGGASMIGPCYNKPRKWIVLEAKYTTYAKWQDQLTFTWHVLLESRSATENKGNREGLAPYSYFTAATTYANIPNGSHAASVCLHPSYLERFGEAKAIGLVITNAKGEILAGNSESEIQGIKGGTEFWKDDAVMNAKGKNGEAMIEQRQGLQDRAKTIWALVNPNDYEMVVQ